MDTGSVGTHLDGSTKDVSVKDAVAVDAVTKDVQIADGPIDAVAKDVNIMPAEAGETCVPSQTVCTDSATCCVSGSLCAPVGGSTQNSCCSPQAGSCMTDDDCCGDLTCDQNNQCAAFGCQPSQSACNTSGDCCDPNAQCTTVGGSTQLQCCQGNGGPCMTDDDCCGQYSCDPNAMTCAPLNCLSLQTPCGSAADCCDPGAQCTTVGGLSQNWCCQPTGGSCQSGNDCCGDLACNIPSGGTVGTCM